MMHTIIFAFFYVILLVFFPTVAKAQQVRSVRWALMYHPEKVAYLMENLADDTPEMREIRQLWRAGGQEKAAQQLLDWFKAQGQRRKWLAEAAKWSETKSECHPDSVLQDHFTFQSVSGRVPVSVGGNLNWMDKGPRNDWEWMYFLNRHYFIADLANAWQRTGQARYAQKADALLADWVANIDLPADSTLITTWLKHPWRPLEAGLRMAYAWPESFYMLMESPDFQPGTQLLVLASMAQHAEFLQQYYTKKSNHAIMQFHGLAKVAVAFPEFRYAESWLQHALNGLQEQLADQVLPDGVQDELSYHYHYVVANHLTGVFALMQAAGRDFPAPMLQTLRAMYRYMAYSLQPDGHNPLNNDSDLRDYRAELRKAAVLLGQTDLLHIGSGGQEGTPPAENSVVFPWAGQAVFRDGWGESSLYSWFEAGPWGTGHQHNDKLHLSLAAYGRLLLSDAGRYSYVRGDTMLYFRFGKSHNTLLIDGKGQNEQRVRRLSEPLPASKYTLSDQVDYVFARHEDGFGDRWNDVKGDSVPVIHERAVVFLKSLKCWVVADRLLAAASHRVEALWHFAPGVQVGQLAASPPILMSYGRGQGNLAILPVGKAWTAEVVEGRTSADVQGWASPTYNQLLPAACGRYVAPTTDGNVFAWVLFPSDGRPGTMPENAPSWLPIVKMIQQTNEWVHLSITTPLQGRTELIINFSETPALTSKKGKTAGSVLLKIGKAGWIKVSS